MKAKLSIYVNFSRLWKSCAYCKAKVHLTTLTEWKLPLAEMDNEKWKILSEIFAKKKKEVSIHLILHEESDRDLKVSHSRATTTTTTTAFI